MQKKILVLLLVAMTSGSAFAQKGMMGIGGNVAVNIGDKPFFGGGAKFQYNVADIFRIEPSFSYYAKPDDHSEGYTMTAIVNGHLFFSSPRPFRPYFFAGAGWMQYIDVYSYDSNYYGRESEEKMNLFGVNVGLGIDYRISHNLSLQIEAGIMGKIGNVEGVKKITEKTNIGVTYNF